MATYCSMVDGWGSFCLHLLKSVAKHPMILLVWDQGLCDFICVGGSHEVEVTKSFYNLVDQAYLEEFLGAAQS